MLFTDNELNTLIGILTAERARRKKQAALEQDHVFSEELPTVEGLGDALARLREAKYRGFTHDYRFSPTDLYLTLWGKRGTRTMELRALGMALDAGAVDIGKARVNRPGHKGGAMVDRALSVKDWDAFATQFVTLVESVTYRAEQVLPTETQ